MNPKIRRWLPFAAILLLILLMSAFMFLNTLKSTYQPNTDDPTRVYIDACAGCHGDKGQGKGIFPALADEVLDSREVREIIMNGAMFMPSFESIKGDTLNQIVDYVVKKNFSD